MGRIVGLTPPTRPHHLPLRVCWQKQDLLQRVPPVVLGVPPQAASAHSLKAAALVVLAGIRVVAQEAGLLAVHQALAEQAEQRSTQLRILAAAAGVQTVDQRALLAETEPGLAEPGLIMAALEVMVVSDQELPVPLAIQGQNGPLLMGQAAVVVVVVPPVLV
jgi:hypothetical protein